MAGKRDAFEDLSPEQRLKMADMKAEGLKASDLKATDGDGPEWKADGMKSQGDDVGLDASTPKGIPVVEDELAPERPVDGYFKFVVPEDADIKGDGYNIESPESEGSTFEERKGIGGNVEAEADAEGFDIAVDKVSAGEVEADSLYVSGADPAIDELAPLDGPDEIVGDLSIDDGGFGDDGLDV